VTDRSDNSLDDPRLLAVLQEYLAEVEAGRHPNRQELLARHPDIAEELSTCLQGLTFVNSAVNQLVAAAQAPRQEWSDPDSPLAQPLGDFKLVRQIGRGGMGVVYEATQLSLNRPVAVKILPFAAALDQRQLQRFKDEAQAAARLHHTNIVPVYSIGCERSVHFYAMQLIDGQSLADVIRELRRRQPSDSSSSLENSSPSRDLSVLRSHHRSDFHRRAARLGLQAAEALEYAHQLGVVHRDIKPANLLIDRRGNLWITDFGLARFYGRNDLTQPGDMPGTLRYMSPEQASGRAAVLDERTDVYSLGVTLYELLALQPAIPGDTREELLSQIDGREPRPLRGVDRSIPVELQTILAKAAAKDPADRYPTAQAMADDLARFLKDEPIRARPPSAWDQAVKWTRRHKSLALGAIVLLFVAAQVLLITTLLIARQEARIAAAYSLARQEAAQANANFEQARDAVNFLTEVAANELPKDPRLVQARERLLEAALGYYQRFIDAHKDDAAVDSALIAARSHIRDILSDLSAMDEMIRVTFSINLLQASDVQRELALTPQQSSRIRSLAASAFSPPPPPATSPADATVLRSRLSAQTHSAEAAIAGALTPRQLTRLQEISRQLRHVQAFTDPDVQSALELTSDQKTTLGQLRLEAEFASPGDESAMQAALALMSPRQTSVWMNLIGRPFSTDERGYDAPPAR
jgi:hypothetical protein